MVWGFGMKTKIIYISGNELFDIADIRAAFETVRAALSLDNDTILFGVPVDKEDAIATAEKPASVTESVVLGTAEMAPKSDTIVEVITPAPEEVIEPKPEKAKKTTRRGRVIPITDTDDKKIESTPQTEKQEATAIPILSVLGANSDSVTEPTPSIDETIVAEPDVSEPIDVEPAVVDNSDNSEPQVVSIDDMLANNDTPIAPHEKTLEELLESMTPLGEDEENVDIATTPVVTEAEPTIETDVVQPQSKTTDDDTDATLELLANEFAESADKMVAPKTDTRGKIGKLKNILPFKKAKRDDSGIMGDLFGWAGVANDEDFTIPGFFANAKK